MREIILSTETGSDMPQDIVEKYQVKVVPMHVIIDGVDHLDGNCFPVETIYDYHERTKKIPTTSAVNVDEYIKFFQDIRREHPGCVIFHFAYSSKASSTYQNALAAIQKFEDIHLIDTATATAGCVAYIIEGHKLIRQRHNPATDYHALADEVRAIAPRISCSFIPGNLEYLKAGGRVSNAAYLGATILQLKPLIEINAEGYLVATKKYRGPIEKIAERYVREFINNHDLNRETIYLIHTLGTSMDVLSKMEGAALNLGYKDCVTLRCGGAISCHSGPGSIGLAGISG